MERRRGGSPLKRFAETVMVAGALSGSAAQAVEAAEPTTTSSASIIEEEAAKPAELSGLAKLRLLKEFVERNGRSLSDGSQLAHTSDGELVLENNTLSWQSAEQSGLKPLTPEQLEGDDVPDVVNRLLEGLQKAPAGETASFEKQLQKLKNLVREMGSPVKYGEITDYMWQISKDEQLVLTQSGQLELQTPGGTKPITSPTDLILHPLLTKLATDAEAN